jgi:hypothetical protein
VSQPFARGGVRAHVVPGRTLAPAHRDQVLALALVELGTVERQHRLVFGHELARTVHDDVLHPARHPKLYALQPGFVGRHEADERRTFADRARLDAREAHADPLDALGRDLHAGEPGDIAGFRRFRRATPRRAGGEAF